MPTLHFHIPYRTARDQRLQLRYTLSSQTSDVLPMQPSQDGTAWTAQFALPASTDWISYSYEVIDADGSVVRREEGAHRRIYPQKRSALQLLDSWSERGIPPVFRHAPFTRTVYGPRRGAIVAGMLNTPHLLLLSALPAPEGYHWGVLGNTPALGAWQPSHAVALTRTQVYEFACPLSSEDLQTGFAYKLVLLDERRPGTVLWEEGEDRYVAPLPGKLTATFVLASSPRFSFPLWRGAGVVVPVFSLRSHSSWGVGDFGDLRKFTQWAASVGMQAVQLLPLNDTTRTGTWRDSYPYSGISVFALHPIYLDPTPWADTPIYNICIEEARALNQLPTLDYEKAFALKMHFLRELYKAEGRTICGRTAYKRFVSENKEWLEPYAEFCVRRDANHTADFRRWKDVPLPPSALGFWRFVQYLLHAQLSAVHAEASALGVILKGDIPIGVCPDSVDVWRQPSLFHQDGSAGAPPDYFSAEGQNWGFPTYNWERMSEDGYSWWKRRFQTMGQYFDAYRIDHVLGFFRIWEIPTSQLSGKLGHFRPALPFSSAEMRQFGFTLPPSQFVRPRLSDSRFARLSAEAGHADLRRFFQKEGGYWTLRPHCQTQTDLLRLTTDAALRRILLDVVTDVLFIEDAQQPAHFHPRIGAQQTPTYAALPAEQQQAFDRLHHHYFFERHNDFWANGARKKFRALLSPEGDAATASLLPCAEDLGMVPACVPGVLREWGMLTLEIQTMPKTFGREFADLSQNPWLSVATIATHDMPPLRRWWQLDPQRTTRFWNEQLHRHGEAPADAPADACEQVVRQHLASPSMLCLIALQDYLGIDETLRHPHPEEEQINNPSNGAHYWRYRMHLCIEDLFSAVNFNERLRLIVRDCGR